MSNDPTFSIGSSRILVVEASPYLLQEACVLLSEAARLGFVIVSQASAATGKMTWTHRRTEPFAGRQSELEAALQKLLRQGNPTGANWEKHAGELRTVCA